MEEIYCFAGNPLDRVSERRRDKDWIASLLADPTSRMLPLYDLKPAIPDMLRPALDWQEIAPWRQAFWASPKMDALISRSMRPVTASPRTWKTSMFER
jgi:hypothetical protein